MTSSFPVSAAIAVLFSGTPLWLAHADDLSGGPGTHATCREMMEKARTVVAQTPAGVEKLAAQQEMASAQMELDKGAEPECQTHVRNALQAIKARAPN
jgi:hypothetical protein